MAALTLGPEGANWQDHAQKSSGDVVERYNYDTHGRPFIEPYNQPGAQPHDVIATWIESAKSTDFQTDIDAAELLTTPLGAGDLIIIEPDEPGWILEVLGVGHNEQSKVNFGVAGYYSLGVQYFEDLNIGIVGHYLGREAIAYRFDGCSKPYKKTLNRFLFQGREWDASIEAYDFRARFYSPKLGRFLSRDPAGYSDSLNLYCFVNNNPVCFRDPTGCDIFSDAWDWVKERWERGTIAGAIRVAAGFLEVAVGAALIGTPFAPLGIALIAHGYGNIAMGAYEIGASEASGQHRTLPGDVFGNQNGFWVQMGWDAAGVLLGFAAAGAGAGAAAPSGNAAAGAGGMAGGGVQVATATTTASLTSTAALPGVAVIASSGINALSNCAMSRLRDNLIRDKGKPPSNMKNPHAHHDMPKELRAKFEKAGFDIDKSEFGRWVEGAQHQRWSYEFNQEWKRFFAKIKKPSPEQLLKQMGKMRNDPRFQ